MSEAIDPALSQRSHRAAVASMESAICTGSVREVKAVLDILGNMGKASIIKELTGCYGGRRGHPPRADDNGLFRMSVPLLHAALTGSIEVFMTVLGAMRVYLRAQQASVFVALVDESGLVRLAEGFWESKTEFTRKE